VAQYPVAPMSIENRRSTGEITGLLQAMRRGEPGALDRLLPLVYDDLRLLARRQLGRESVPRTLPATGLVHEAYLKLAAGRAVDATDRAHFLAIAARAMRQVLVDHARRRSATRRGGAAVFKTLTDGVQQVEFDPNEILSLNEALEQLDPRQREVVECRFFAGMEEREIAMALGVSERTVRREWVKARAWLYRFLYGEPGTSPPLPDP
jgi:RNA polymerase sigma-70 factor, ECF subfamily